MTTKFDLQNPKVDVTLSLVATSNQKCLHLAL